MARLFAVVGWIFSVIVALIAFFVATQVRCDESCDGAGWRRSEDGWQWDALAGLAVLVFVAGTAFVACIWRRRAGAATFAFLVGVAATLTYGIWLIPDSVDHLDRRSAGDLAVALIGVGAPLLAIVLTPRRE